MYKIYADDVLIYDSTLEDYKICKGQVTKETDKSGSFVFSLYPDHFYYDNFAKMRTVVTVHKSGRIVFRGRVLDDAVDHWNCKTLKCEGELGFLQDTIQRPGRLSGAPQVVFRQILIAHNGQADDFKQFKLGTCTMELTNVISDGDEYMTTLASLQELVDTYGGHLYITHGDAGTDPIPTLHWVKDFPKVATQPIEFGVNLKNYAKKTNAADIATSIIPLGAKVDDGNSDTEDPRLTIANVNGGLDWIYSEPAVELYGRIYKVVTWDNVTDPEELRRLAYEHLDILVEQAVTVELTAVDMHLLDRSIESYECCDYVPILSTPHRFEATLLCNKQTLDLLKPENDTVTLGHTYSTFTDRVNKGATVAVQQLRSSLNQMSNRLNRLENVAVDVRVTDVSDFVPDLLRTRGLLTVGEHVITTAQATVVVPVGRVLVTYTLTAGLTDARMVQANGVELGVVAVAGDTVSTSVQVGAGSELAVVFTAAENTDEEGGTTPSIPELWNLNLRTAAVNTYAPATSKRTISDDFYYYPAAYTGAWTNNSEVTNVTVGENSIAFQSSASAFGVFVPFTELDSTKKYRFTVNPTVAGFRVYLVNYDSTGVYKTNAIIVDKTTGLTTYDFTPTADYQQGFCFACLSGTKNILGTFTELSLKKVLE